VRVGESPEPPGNRRMTVALEKSHGKLCADKGFYDCIARPFLAGLFGKREEGVGAQANVQ